MTNQNESSETNKLSAFGKFVELNKLSADYEHWAAATSWTVTETAFLINGICPDKALFDRSMNIGPLNTLYGEGLKLGYAPFLTIEKQLKLLQRAKNDGHLLDRNKPTFALSWCMQEGFQILTECVKAVTGHVDKRAYWADLQEIARQKLEGETEDQADAPEAGETKTENLLRLIGILKDMLAKPKVIDQLKRDPTAFSKQKDLIQYISGLYAEDHPNKGLQVSNLNQIFSEANKVLKADKEP